MGGHGSMQSADVSELSVTCVTTLNLPESHTCTDIDAVDPEEDPARHMEPADITDADAFEVLMQRNTHSTAVPTQHAVNMTAEVSDISIEQAIPFDMPNAETSAVVVISCFLLDSMGVPIHSTPQGSPEHELNEDMAAYSIWAPFSSQCDWQVANWAKMHGLILSALTDLLAIEEVHGIFLLI